MQRIMRKITIGFALTAIAAFAQTKPAFEVATIKPSPPMDPAKIAAALQAGGKMPIGANVEGYRAEYRYLDLRSLMSYAYGVKPYQITGPDWMATERFDIVAKMPEGSKREDAPKMLQALLEERFKLTTHHASAEHPVLALVAGKGGPKLKESAEKPVAIDENAPLKPGELKMEGSDGPVRVKVDPATGSSVIDMGLQGKMSFRLDPAKGMMHLDFSGTTMTGFADMVTQLFAQLGGTGGRQVVDMTGIQGNYDATVDLGLAEIIAMARAAGADIPAGAPGGGPRGGNAPVVASDPGSGGTSLADAVQSMGLKLESRKATVDQLIVDHIEKTPTEN
jgi:uncharacterized protein (TIGR03435 family)